MAGPRDSAVAEYLQPSAYPAWKDTATETPACRGVDVEAFFTDRKGAALDEARALCARCPLLITCRTWALDQNPRWLYGVWGGTTQYERQKIRARRTEVPA